MINLNKNRTLDMLGWRLSVAMSWLNWRNWNDAEARTRNQIYYTARMMGYSAENAEFLVKQSNIETGFQKLGFYARGTNNLFGMHYPRVRPSLNAGSMNNEREGGLMSLYRNSGQSIIDRIMWDEYNKIDKQSFTYAQAVQDSNYNPDPLYVQKVSNTDSRLSSQTWYVWLILIVVLVVVTLWVRSKF